ncbi:MAG: LysR family transcriptional regulator [Gammaproteobacteria bacterium]|nr:LysR family transcriptional regulator [Gammaproteobacteria bacterium]
MELRKLEFLREVARSGSFKRAAEAMHVSAPALTKGIQALEQELQVTLFDRKRGKPLLTQAGQKVLVRARRMLDEAQEIQADMARERGLETGELRVGCGPIVMQNVMGRALGKLSVRHPGLRVRVVAGNWETLSQQLEDYALDLVAADIGQARNKPKFKVLHLEQESLVWIAGVNHPLAGAKNIKITELLRYPLALPTPPTHMGNWLVQRYGAEIATPLTEPSIRSDSYTTLISAVRRSQCLSVLPASLAHYLESRGEISLLEVHDWAMPSHAGIITLTARAPSAAIDVMVNALVESSADIKAEIDTV